MSSTRGDLKQGTIVWAVIADPRGSLKHRPAVIITASEEIILDQPIVAVAVTTSFPNPPPDSHVELPWNASGSVQTGLRRRSAAVCEWLVRLRPSDVAKINGVVPHRQLLEIVEKVNRLNRRSE